MINPSEIKKKAERLYPDLLKAVVKAECFFPKDFPIGTLPKDFIALRNEVIVLIEQSKQTLGYGYNLELKTRNTHKYGHQSLPERITIETEIDYLKFINKEKELTQFKRDIELIRLKVPELENWIYDNPLKVIQHTEKWEDLLKVCQYFQKNPRPNLYIRELPIQVHTKFIEENQTIIRSLLENILPPDALQSVESPKEHSFEKRFYLKYREPLIRLRILDNSIKKIYKFPISDFQTPISEFRELNFQPHRFIITENLMNFLTLPPLINTCAIWGGGYAVQALKSVSWLADCPLFYWGDLDTHGFEILSQFRGYFPHTVSVMMDEQTFKSFEEFTVSGVTSKIENIPHLTAEEYHLYVYLKQHQKRLEQERISQNFVNEYLQNLFK
ncbi:DUF3322 domain-containing protein [Gloeothece verrucosa]|uniref:Wadjet protein JetD C-terminal domain-containing protein n=1 Tax=Gloeothece verrucosa (strain PCC 7822) TaxID=497965 RepID=E0U8M8_GLOV7|nr:DUF3322 domain-containing protein [Gloeothece verrucosa]ADN13774.1 conserved hypothetical protein [Gloeothece verrucosa PCC 7822]